MKPFKSAIPFAKWLLRVAVALLVYSRFFDQFTTFSFNNFSYFIALIMIIAALLLLIGGVLPKPKVTVISGLLLFIISIVIIISDGLDYKTIVENISVLSIGFYFMCRGNLG